jgi:hypothetical protein
MWCPLYHVRGRASTQSGGPNVGRAEDSRAQTRNHVAPSGWWWSQARGPLSCDAASYAGPTADRFDRRDRSRST